MGDILRAICKCGYQSGQIMHGIGFSFAKDGIFYEAAYCDHCGTVEGVDGRDEHPKCRRCKGPMRFYQQDISHSVEIGELEFPEIDFPGDRKYWHCPSCKRQTLTFVNAGLWD